LQKNETDKRHKCIKCKGNPVTLGQCLILCMGIELGDQ